MGCRHAVGTPSASLARGATRRRAIIGGAALLCWIGAGCVASEEAGGLAGVPGGGLPKQDTGGGEADVVSEDVPDVPTGPAAPTVTIEAPAALACVGQSLTLSVKAEHELGIALVEAKMGDIVVASVTKGKDGVFTLEVDLSEVPEGPISALVVVTAKNGDKAQALGTWTADRTAPTVELQTPVGGDVIVGDLEVLGVASDEGCGIARATAVLSGAEEDVTGEQTYEEPGPQADFGVSLASGDQGTFDGLLQVDVEDAAGNVTTVTRQVYVVQPLRFLQAVGTPSGKAQLGLRGGDWDGDGFDDAIVFGGEGVNVMLSLGDGSFGPPQQVVASKFGSLDLADLDGDGALDVVGAVKGKSWEVQVWMRQADGTCAMEQTFPVEQGLQPSSLTLADLTGDDQLELVMTTPSDNKSVLVVLGNPEDAWGDVEGQRALFSSTTQSFGGVANGRDPHAADFDGDGNMDVVVGSKGDSKVSVFLGDGSGGFLAAYDTVVDEDPIALAVGYFSGGAWPDLLVASEKSGRLYVLGGKGNGYFQPNPLEVYGSKPSSIVTGHFDGDDTLDFAVAYSGSNAVQVFGGGHNPMGGYVTGPNPSSAVAGLFTSDDVLDIAVLNASSGMVTLLPGNGDGTFAAAPVVPMPVECGATCSSMKPRVFAVAELNGLAGLDAIVAEKITKEISLFYVFESNGVMPTPPANVILYPSNFQRDLDNDVAGTPKGALVDLVTGDFDGDGLSDFAVAYATKFTVSQKVLTDPVSIDVFIKKAEPGLSYEDPAGFWAGLPVAVAIPEGSTQRKADDVQKKRADAAGIVDIAAGDMDNDGADDLVVLTKFAPNVGDEIYESPHCAARVSVFRSKKNGSFERISSAAVDASVQTDPGVVRLMLGDVNVDGSLDAVVLNAKISDVAVLYGDKGALSDGNLVSVVSANPLTAELVQVNGDEDVFPDVLSVGKDVRVAFGRPHAEGEQPFETPFTYSNYPGKKPTSIDGGDLNGDGITDLVIADSSANAAYLYAGIGDRQFARDPVVIPTGLAPRWVDVRDMDGDGCVDVITAGDGGMTLLRSLLCE